jgi:hypothetical protein
MGLTKNALKDFVRNCNQLVKDKHEDYAGKTTLLLSDKNKSHLVNDIAAFFGLPDGVPAGMAGGNVDADILANQIPDIEVQSIANNQTILDLAAAYLDDPDNFFLTAFPSNQIHRVPASSAPSQSANTTPQQPAQVPEQASQVPEAPYLEAHSSSPQLNSPLIQVPIPLPPQLPQPTCSSAGTSQEADFARKSTQIKLPELPPENISEMVRWSTNEYGFEGYEADVKGLKQLHRKDKVMMQKLKGAISSNRHKIARLVMVDREVKRLGGKQSFIDKYSRDGHFITCTKFKQVINARNKAMMETLYVEELETYPGEDEMFADYLDTKGTSRNKEGLKKHLLAKYHQKPLTDQFPNWEPNW